MDRLIYNSRPADKRSVEEEAVYDVLDNLGIDFERVDWTPEDEGSENVYQALGIMRLKNLLLCNAQKNKFYLLVMPASVPLSLMFFQNSLALRVFHLLPKKICESFCM